MSKRISVSAVIPAYNSASTLEAAISSVQNQTHSVDEIIVVNDGSEDDTARVAEGAAKKDKRINVIHQKNSGVSSARNRGVTEAFGTFVAFLDADDVWGRDHIKLTLALNPDSALRAGMKAGSDQIKAEDYDSKSYIARVLDRGWGFHISGLVASTELLRKEPSRCDYSTGEDFDLVLRILWHHDVRLTIGPHVSAICDFQGNAKPVRIERLSWAGLDRPNAIIEFCDEELCRSLDRETRRLLLALRRRTEMSVLKSLAAQRRFPELVAAAKRLRGQSRSASLRAICSGVSLAAPFVRRKSV